MVFTGAYLRLGGLGASMDCASGRGSWYISGERAGEVDVRVVNDLDNAGMGSTADVFGARMPGLISKGGRIRVG